MKEKLAKIFAVLAALTIFILVVTGLIYAFIESIGLGIISLIVVVILTSASILNC